MKDVADQNTGKLLNNLVIKKALIDLKGKEYDEVENLIKKRKDGYMKKIIKVLH